MKVLKKSYYGSPVLGVCTVQILQDKAGKLEVKSSQGTSYKSYNAKDMENAETIYEGLCAHAEMVHGTYDKAKWGGK